MILYFMQLWCFDCPIAHNAQLFIVHKSNYPILHNIQLSQTTQHLIFHSSIYLFIFQ